MFEVSTYHILLPEILAVAIVMIIPFWHA